MVREPAQTPERIWEIRRNQDTWDIQVDPGQLDVRPGWGGKDFCRWCNAYHYGGDACVR